MYIYFLAHQVKLTWMREADLGRRGAGDDRILCRNQTYLQDSSG